MAVPPPTLTKKFACLSWTWMPPIRRFAKSPSGFRKTEPHERRSVGWLASSSAWPPMRYLVIGSIKLGRLNERSSGSKITGALGTQSGVTHVLGLEYYLSPQPVPCVSFAVLE